MRLRTSTAGWIVRSCLLVALGFAAKFNVVSADNPAYVWVKVTDRAPFAARDGAGALVYQDQMWLLGGWNPGDKAHFPRICNNEVWSSRDGAEWTLVKPNTFLDARFESSRDWEGRHTAGCAVFQDALWMVTGNNMEPDVWKLTRKSP